MKKKGYILLIIALMLGMILGVINVIMDRNREKALKKHFIEEYNFEISYPDAYVDISKSGDDESTVLSNLTTKESGEQISEYMQKLNFVETVRDLKNELNGIKMSVEAIKIEKTELSLEEICNRYVVMFQVYNEDVVLNEIKKEIITLDGKETGKVTIKVDGKVEDSVVIAYLISTQDREITVTFIAPETTVQRFEDEINKIINSLKIY